MPAARGVLIDQTNGMPVSPDEIQDSPSRTSTGASAPRSATPSIGGSIHNHNGPVLNARSCVTCRRRKVKCNKQYPCSNCSKAHVDCIFPAPGRAPRRPRKPPDGELLLRLRRLEGVIQSLGVHVDDDPRLTGVIPAEFLAREDGNHDPTTPNLENKISFPTDQSYQQGPDPINALGNGFGRLVINEGRSRYVNSRFWAALSTEVEDLKGVLDESSEEEGDLDSPLPDPTPSASQHGFLFNGSPSNTADLHSLHPSPARIRTYWQSFVDNCDPLMKMLHIPSMQPQIYAAAENPGRSSKAIEVLLFAIYYATVTSMSPEECEETAGETQETLAKRYRYGLEQALVRAHFLLTEEIVVLQAFILFLVCLRRFEDPRVLWSYCGIACRIAITLGLHHDGANLGAAPFDIEIRRRTWWQLLILDIRSSEDHGSDPVIVQHSFDTRFPSNVEDDDLDPSMTMPPVERDGITKMSYTLTRYYTAMTFARIFARPANFLSPTGSWREPSFQEKQRWIQHCQQRLEERFFRHFNMDEPMHWITYTVARLILAKQWFMIYQPFLKSKLGADLPAATRDHLFVTSLEAVEASVMLERKRVFVRWGWLFKAYTQFHALAFMLSELTRRTSGPMVDRAWRALEDVKNVLWEIDPETKKGPRIKPILRLEALARAARERAQTGGDDDDSASDEDDIKLEEEEQNSPAGVDFTMMNTVPGSNQIGFNFDQNSVDAMTNLSGIPALPTYNQQPMQAHNEFSGFYGGARVPSAQIQAQVPMVGSAPQWSEALSNPPAGNNPMPDWFIEQPFIPVPGNVSAMNSGFDPSLHTQHQQHQAPVAQPLPQIHNQHHLAQQRQQQQQHPQPMNPTIGEPEGAAIQWGEWDEIWDDVLMSGQPSTVPPQWQRRPNMNETWL